MRRDIRRPRLSRMLRLARRYFDEEDESPFEDREIEIGSPGESKPIDK